MAYIQDCLVDLPFLRKSYALLIFPLSCECPSASSPCPINYSFTRSTSRSAPTTHHTLPLPLHPHFRSLPNHPKHQCLLSLLYSSSIVPPGPSPIHHQTQAEAPRHPSASPLRFWILLYYRDCCSCRSWHARPGLAFEQCPSKLYQGEVSSTNSEMHFYWYR